MEATISYEKSNSEIVDPSYVFRKINKAINGRFHYDHEISLAIQMEAEKLRAENEALKFQLEENEKYKETVGQAVHDIRTPLSVLLISLDTCSNLSEKEREMFRDSIISIQKIAKEFLGSSKNKEKKQDGQYIQVSQVLQETVNQKTIQYKNKNVEFKYSFDRSLQFTFIYGNPLNFERMMSNIINNSVEAFENKKGTVEIELLEDDGNIKITIQDNGKGMSQKTIEKLMSGKSVSTTKQDGFGIGTAQIQKTIRGFKGKQFIESEQEVGTKITLTIPKLHCPWWFANKINLNEGDTVVVLDVDSSMFDLMKKVFEPYSGDITLKFFENGKETIDFIRSFEEKDKLILLADYDLRNQKINGLDVIKNSYIGKDRSILVTSSYSNMEIQKKVCSLGAKIISKRSVENIEIVFKKQHPESEVDVIVLEDDELFATTVSELLGKDDLKVKIYRNPRDFLSNLIKYSKNVKIIIDNYYNGDSLGEHITGDIFAKELFEKGFANICLLTGVPDITHVLSKYPDGINFVKKGSESWDKRLLLECKRP